MSEKKVNGNSEAVACRAFMRNARLKPDAKKPPKGPINEANSENITRWMQNGFNVIVTPVGSALRNSRVCTRRMLPMYQ